MKYSVEDRSSVKKVLHIEVPSEKVSQEIEKAYQNLKKTAKIKGFRPGKAPRQLLERLYRKDVLDDVRSNIIQGAFLDALKQSALRMVGSPKIDPPEMKEAQEYRFDVELEIAPEIGPVEFQGLTLKKNKYAVSDAELDMQLKMVRKNLAQRKKIDDDRPAKTGDIVVIDYEGFKDGKTFEQTERTENFITQIGEGQVVKDLDDGLVGMKVGEQKEIDVAFPDDYFSKGLAGQKLLFKVKLNEIREEILPELNDALAKEVSEEFENLDQLKAKIRENLRGGYEKRAEQELNEQVFQHLLAKTAFEVPDTLIDAEIEHIVRDAEEKFAHNNRKFEDVGLSREKLVETYRPTAEKQVRRYLILDKLISQERLGLTDAELEQGFQDMARAYRQPVEHLKGYYQQNQEGLSFFKHALLEKKALKIIIERSAIEEVDSPQGAEV
jgi:trigger factor